MLLSPGKKNKNYDCRSTRLPPSRKNCTYYIKDRLNCCFFTNQSFLMKLQLLNRKQDYDETVGLRVLRVSSCLESLTRTQDALSISAAITKHNRNKQIKWHCLEMYIGCLGIVLAFLFRLLRREHLENQFSFPYVN